MQKTRVNAASDPYQNQGPGVNLTNILPAAFTTYMQLEKAAKTTFVRKIRT